MGEFKDLWFLTKFEIGRKVAPILYKTAFSKEQKTKYESELDSFASGLVTLLDKDPTKIQNRLGLDGKQMRDLLFLGKLSSENRLTRTPIELETEGGQRFLSTLYEGSDPSASTLDFLNRHDVRLSVFFNVSNDLPVSAGIWGRKGRNGNSESVQFMFLSVKPLNANEKEKGTHVDLMEQSGWDTEVFGNGERIDFSQTYERKKQKTFTKESFLYLGQFEWESGSGTKVVHCWGHNRIVNSKSIPISQSVTEPGFVTQPSRVVA